MTAPEYTPNTTLSYFQNKLAKSSKDLLKKTHVQNIF